MPTVTKITVTRTKSEIYFSEEELAALKEALPSKEDLSDKGLRPHDWWVAYGLVNAVANALACAEERYGPKELVAALVEKGREQIITDIYSFGEASMDKVLMCLYNYYMENLQG